MFYEIVYLVFKESTMILEPTINELNDRIERFCLAMNSHDPSWNTAVILSKVNQYYFTGTMQDGMVVIKPNKKVYYFIRRSYERAKNESLLDNIFPMESYRDATIVIDPQWGNTYFETEIVTIGIMKRLEKYFHIEKTNSLDQVVGAIRAVKSEYELEWMKKSGHQHYNLLQNIVPSLLIEGISEAGFAAEVYEKMVKLGYQGISRFSMFQTEMVVGQIGFGESSLYPTSFDGPGGALGMYPSVPLLGSRDRKLKKGDLVFVDIAYGINGYHSDKTQIYMFGGKPTKEMIDAHRQCMDIQNRLAESLKPGAIPSDLYNSSIHRLDANFKQNFMGFNKRKAKFLGHGVGLHIDELPIIANGYQIPLEENMTIALEPKKGIPKVGMVGVEETYYVTPEGGICITGGSRDIIIV